MTIENETLQRTKKQYRISVHTSIGQTVRADPSHGIEARRRTAYRNRTLQRTEKHIWDIVSS